MIHPSYLELMNSINNEEGDNLEKVESRYSIVIAASKRARQLTDGAKPKVVPQNNKALSTAVDELFSGMVHIVTPSAAEEEESAAEEESVLEAENAAEEAEGTEEPEAAPEEE